jgi:hypothetical protein
VVAMAGWQTGGLSVNKVWCSDNKMGAGSIRQQQPGVILSRYEMVVYWAGLMCQCWWCCVDMSIEKLPSYERRSIPEPGNDKPTRQDNIKSELMLSWCDGLCWARLDESLLVGVGRRCIGVSIKDDHVTHDAYSDAAMTSGNEL